MMSLVRFFIFKKIKNLTFISFISTPFFSFLRRERKQIYYRISTESNCSCVTNNLLKELKGGNHTLWLSFYNYNIVHIICHLNYIFCIYMCVVCILM